jgi:hypothetical protein
MLPLRADVLLSNTLFEELDDGITPDFLRQHTGKDNLEEVESLELQVDAVSGSQRVECLGEHMPYLQQVRLTQSAVCTIRDLGTNYAHLRVLWLCRSSLQDLGGITAMPVLEELYISFNDITDLSPIATHDSLQVLDVEGNLIEDFDEIASLQTVRTLRELTLSSNPVTKAESFSREAVLEALPQLQVLDDILVGEKSSDGLQVLEVTDEEDDPAFLDPYAGLEDLMDPTSSGSDKDIEPCRLFFDEEPEKEVETQEDTENSEAVAQMRKGLEKLRAELASSAGSPVKLPTTPTSEPTEQDLIVENVKRSKKVPHFSRSGDVRPCTGFCPDRRGLRTAWSGSGSSTTYRPPSSAGGSFVTTSSGVTTSSAAYSAVDDDPNSALTAGDDGTALAGNALSAIRRRRKVEKENGKDEHSIRDMLKRFETYKQESCLPVAELKLRRQQSETKRPGTSDVRVSAPRLLTASGRPAALPSSLPGAPGESWVRNRGPQAGFLSSKPGAPGESWVSLDGPKKKPSSRSRRGDFADDDFYKPTFSTEAGEALIID